MATLDSMSMNPPYPAREFSLRGVAQDVTHISGGKPTVRTAVVEIVNTTFLDRGSTRKTSTASCTFLEHVSIQLEDTLQLPDGEPMKIIKVTSRYGRTVQSDGRLTVVLLA